MRKALPSSAGGGSIFFHFVFQDHLFNGRLRLIGQLEAFVRKDLDPVILERVVGGRYDDAGIGSHAAGQKGDTRRGDDAHENGIDAHGTDARHKGVFQHIPGKARVFSRSVFWDDGPCALNMYAVALPTLKAVSAVIGYSFATPRIPSVPNSVPIYSSFAVMYKNNEDIYYSRGCFAIRKPVHFLWKNDLLNERSQLFRVMAGNTAHHA